MVPSGWFFKNLEDIASVERGKFSARPRNDPKYYGGPIPFVQTGDIARAGTYLTSYTQTLNQDGLKVSRLFPSGTILITIAANIGDLALTSFDVACPDSLVAIQTNQNTDTVWLYFYLTTCKQELEGKATQNAQKNINLQVLKPLQILTPPLSEQNKIAKILSTWDKAISTTERLIDNSKQQKKALMQQLLTGKKRLLDDSGKLFEGEWVNQQLNEVAQIIVSPVDKKTIEGEIPVKLCNYTDVYYNTRITKSLQFMHATAKASEIAKYTLHVNDVIVTKDSETPGDIAIPALVSEDLDGILCGYHLAIVRPDNTVVEGAFLNYLFSVPKTRYYFFTLATGATRFGLSVGAINNASIALPPIIEQVKIAEALTKADKVIDVLEKQLADLTFEKRALIQQLLTGKRRVNVN